MQGKKIYQEKLFTSFQLSSHVPEDNIYRKILQLIDFDFLYSRTSKYYGTEGQSSIDPVVFFKLMLVGYLEDYSSDRKIISSSAMRMDILFFIGYDIDEALPWHSTLSRTRQLYGQDIFLTLFQQVLTRCINAGMLSGKRHAIDSVFVKANASMDSLQRKEILQDAKAYTAQLDENGDPSTSLKKVTKTKEDDDTELSKKRPKCNNKTHYSPSDPDARLSFKPGKPYLLNYLGQVAVDTGSHLITHIEAFFANQKDSQHLERMARQIKENLKGHGLELEEILADGNYSSIEALEALKRMEITGFIPNFGQYKSTREGFTYDAEKDQYTCSQGKVLEYKGLKKSYSPSKKYLSNASDCKGCPIKSTCIGKSSQKMLTEVLARPLYEEMEQRVKSKTGQRMKKLRSSTVEPVIGSLVDHHRAKKINTKGLENASKWLLMSGIAYNLKKLLNYRVKPKTGNVGRGFKKTKTGGNFINTYLNHSILSNLSPYSFNTCCWLSF